MKHLLSQHKDACKVKDCRSCSIDINFAAEWDATHRGKALKERFGYTKGIWLLHNVNFPVTPRQGNGAEGTFCFLFFLFFFAEITQFFFIVFYQNKTCSFFLFFLNLYVSLGLFLNRFGSCTRPRRA